MGTYEWFGQQALTRFFGVDPSAAAAAILVMHVFAVGPVIIMGFAFLWRDGLSFSGLTRGVRSGGEGTVVDGNSLLPASRAIGEAARPQPPLEDAALSPSARPATGADR